MDKKLLNKLALETGGSHYPSVFYSHQELYTMLVLQECYKVFQEKQGSGVDYLAMDFLYDIMKHFELDPKDIVP